MNSMKEWFASLKTKMDEDTRVKYGVYGGVLAVIILIVVIVAVSCTKSKKEEITPVVSENKVEEVSDNASEVVAASPIETTVEVSADDQVNGLVQSYFDALTNGDTATVVALKSESTEDELLKIQKKAAYMDSINNLTVYTKPGPTEGTYIAFVYYEIKFKDIETMAPGLTTLYICTKDDGSLYICNGELEDTVNDYIKQVAAEEDIADLFNKVQVNYNNAVANDVALSLFMENLQATLDAEVAAQKEADAQAAAAAAGETAEAQPAETTVVTETVEATDTVNVRASDSENADKLGKVDVGTTMTRYETRENGWSKIDYNGQEGYIKSEFLKVVAVNETTAEPAADTEQPAETTSSATITGKISVKDTVNVRASASESGDRIGTAYKGENYDLIMEQADGWCKISFNGKTGYVKSEYVSIN